MKMNEIVVIVEHDGKTVKQTSYETISFALEFAKNADQIAVLVPGAEISSIAKEVAKRTKLKVIGIESPYVKFYNAQAYISLFKKYFENDKPKFIFIPHTPTGWDYAPQLALSLNASYTPAVISFKFDGKAIFTRQVLNGKLLADFALRPDKSSVITVMPGVIKNVFTSPRNGEEKEIRITKIELAATTTKTVGYVEIEGTSEELTKADIIIAIGRGIGSPDNIPKVKKLVSLIPHTAIASSRPLCDMGWMPIETQVGMTGKTVAPKVYIALGISGAIQHTMGMQNSETIIVVNTDKNTFFFKKAHYCVIADINEFVSAMIEKLK